MTPDKLHVKAVRRSYSRADYEIEKHRYLPKQTTMDTIERLSQVRAC